MKLYAPAYYEKFACIADKCRHSCCVGWEIDIDPHTMTMYKGLSGGYGDAIRHSIDESSDTPHFRLCDHDKCPHLDERGLCRIITNLGEGYLCHICREHPRFYNQTLHGKEVGLGMACEEACRIILSADNFADMVVIGDIEGNIEVLDFDALPYRDKIFSILGDTTLTYEQKLRTVSQTFGVGLDCRTEREWREVLGALEYLDEGHKALFEVYAHDVVAPAMIEAYLVRTLAYFVYRHGTSAYDQEDFLASLGFGLFCVQLMTCMAVSQKVCDLSGLVEIGRIVSEELEYSEENTQAIKWEFLF